MSGCGVSWDMLMVSLLGIHYRSLYVMRVCRPVNFLDLYELVVSDGFMTMVGDKLQMSLFQYMRVDI
jgi:hypothetical protein